MIIVLFLVGIITSYAKVYRDEQRNVDPFVTNISSGYDLTETVYMDGEDFNEFGLDFQCTSYDDDAHKATFVVKTYENDHFKQQISTGEIKLTSSITVRVCLTADLSGKALYSSERTTNKLAPTLEDATSSNYKSEHTISNIIDLPFEIDCFPFDIKVKEPTAYVYVKYSFTRNGQSYTNSYILKYSYEEFNILSGGIIK